MDHNVPSLMNAVVLSPGGPYAPGDALAVAFVRPTIGRLLKHDGAIAPAGPRLDDVVPHAISVRIATGAEPYAAGDVVTLSFVDPGLARIHAAHDDVSRARERDVSQRPFDAPVSVAPEAREMRDVAGAVRDVPPSPAAAATSDSTEPLPSDHSDDRDGADTTGGGISVRTVWTVDRAHRFVQVVDKLFTIDRLGWYRHVFAMRLLLPDEIACSVGDDASTASVDDVASTTAMRRLDAVRAAATATLGRPLLAAFMPNFSVSAEWLETIETPELARTLGDLREALVPFARAANPVVAVPSDPALCRGTIARDDVDVEAAACVDAFLATLIPTASRHVALGVQLDGYRRALVDAFAQTSHSAGAVRLGRMCEPNHALDDRLWQLVGLIGASFGALAVA